MHNYFVAFVYKAETDTEGQWKFDNCIAVDLTDTATAISSQLDGLVSRLTEQIRTSVGLQNDVKIINITKMN